MGALEAEEGGGRAGVEAVARAVGRLGEHAEVDLSALSDTLKMLNDPWSTLHPLLPLRLARE